MKKAYHHGNLKQELIEQGIQMVQQEGIERLSLRRLAAQAGVSEAAPYNHFSGKEALLRAMQEYVTELLLQKLQQAAGEAENAGRDVMLGMGKAYVLFFMQNPAYYNFLFAYGELRIDLSMQENRENYPPFQYFKEVAYRIYQQKGLSEERIKYGIIAMWAKVHGLAAISSMKYVTRDFAWEKVLDQILVE